MESTCPNSRWLRALVARAVLVPSVALVTSLAARADEFGDLKAEALTVAPLGGGQCQVTVRMSATPSFLAATQLVPVRLYASGVPVDEILLDPQLTEGKQRCVNGVCPKGVGWDCVNVCMVIGDPPQFGTWCGKQIQGNFSVAAFQPGSTLTAVIDPDAWHVEADDANHSNNSIGAIVPIDAVCDVGIDAVHVVAEPVTGMYHVDVDVSLARGTQPMMAPIRVSLATSAGPLTDFFIDTLGIPTNQCCPGDPSLCDDVPGWTNTCGGTCAGGTGSGAYSCIIHQTKSSQSYALAPGETITAVVDPDGWHFETCSTSASNNAATAVVPPPVYAYCTGKLNTAGCVPTVVFSGTPSASSPTPFSIAATQVLPGRNGVLFYGHQQTALPFLGGTLCVHTPVRRTGLQTSSGSPAQLDCSGVFAYDFNARIQSGIDPTLVPGANVGAQYWYRDSASSAGSGLSNALWFQIAN